MSGTPAFRLPKKTDRKLDFDTYHGLVSVALAQGILTFSQDFSVTRMASGVFIQMAASSGTSSIDMSKFTFGYTVSGAVVTVNAGYIKRGKSIAYLLAGDDITITADGQWIAVEYVFATNTPNFALTPTYPIPDSTAYRWALHKWTLSGGAASINMIHHVGDLDLPGTGA